MPRRGDIQSFFGRGCPSKNIPFPASANVTAVELSTFLPNCVKSADVVYRFASNGASHNVLWAIINTCRVLEKEWTRGKCGTFVYKAMRQAGFDKWTFGIHKRWYEARAATWNERSISVAGFRTPCQIGEGGTQSAGVPFANLAVDIWRFPKGAGALDLMRMVDYCVVHPEEGWQYPFDYERLLAFLGGSKQVSAEHLDRVAFERWKDVQPPSLPSEAQRSLLRARYRRVDDPVEETPTHKARAAGPQGTATPNFVRIRSRPASITPHSSLPSGHDRRSTRSVRVQKDESIVTSGKSDTKKKVDARTANERPRSLAYWVAPPSGPVAYSDVTSLDFGQKGLPDVLAPYDFLGPRTSSPFRPLNCMGHLDLDDLSDWAENLRWAAEQRTAFGAAANGWNESPEHVSRISRIRKAQQWIFQERQQSLRQVYSSIDEYVPGGTNGFGPPGAESLVDEVEDLPSRWYEEEVWFDADVAVSWTG
jgi:hypothetical protein